jgi:hypothetical protein
VDRYFSIGLGLVSFGLIFTFFSYFILFNTPLTALGLACIILGATAASLPEHVVPQNAMKAMLRGTTLNIEALLEEFEAKESAVYLPPRNGLVSVYVPLASNPKSASIAAMQEAPRRVLSMADGEPGLIVFPPGAEVVRVSELGEDVSLEETLRYFLGDVTELCSSVKVSELEGDIILEMKNVKVRTEAPKYRTLLGSIPSSLAACVIASVTKRSVRLIDERDIDGRQIISRFKIE